MSYITMQIGGAQITVPDEPPIEGKKPTPTRVTMAKAQIAMSRKGVLKAVDAAIQEMPGTAGDEARIQWSKEPFVNRSAPLVAVLASAFKWSDEYVDELFVLADSIP
mgnify:FL=1